MKRALVLGAGGQDGSYLCDILLEKGYEVHGLVRRTSHDNLGRIKHLEGKVKLHYGDITDPVSLISCLGRLGSWEAAGGVDEIYNVADQDQVAYSRISPLHQIQVTYTAVAQLLELLRGSKAKLFQPVSATMFGGSEDSCHRFHEQSNLAPDSPYACAKAATFHLCRHYRKNHNLSVYCGIMFNHDSERRGDGYLLQKIARAAVENKPVALGDLSHKVDIGYAKEYMEAVVAMMQLEQPDDFVVATGMPMSIRQIVDAAASVSEWQHDILKVHDFIAQPLLIGDSTKLRKTIGWQPVCNASSLVQKIVLALKRK